jgi:hypothetical protein
VAPLIPDNQSIKLWLRAPNLLTYAATVWTQGDKPINANEWQVIMHHGSAYALDITAYMMAYLAKFSVDIFCGQPVFYADADALTTPITSAMSFSVFYWKLRQCWQSAAPRLCGVDVTDDGIPAAIGYICVGRGPWASSVLSAIDARSGETTMPLNRAQPSSVAACEPPFLVLNNSLNEANSDVSAY